MNLWRALPLLAALTFGAGAVAVGPPRLDVPADCIVGKTCFIQQYVDHDPGPGARDFACGGLSYEGHKGTDFGLPTLAAMQAGVDVLAPADGIVRNIRDEMPDTGYSPATAAAIDGRDCGNGVAIRHDDGWETQLCHMRLGSITVRPGESVTRGQKIGQIGLSGRTEFPHVHITLRQGPRTVDPFAPEAAFAAGPCTPGGGEALWTQPLEYTPGGILSLGFAQAVPAYDAVKEGAPSPEVMPADAPALVLYGYAFGGRAGDQLRLSIAGPAGAVIDHSAPVEKDQAQFFRAAGKRRPPGGWPAGTYRGTVELLRDGRPLDAREIGVTLR